MARSRLDARFLAAPRSSFRIGFLSTAFVVTALLLPAQIVPPPGLPPAGFGPGLNVFSGVPPLGAASPWDVKIRDFTGDGIPDLLSAELGAGRVALSPGISANPPAFAPVAIGTPVGGVPGLGSPQAVAVADFNGDGAVDAIVACRGLGVVLPTVEVLINAGGGAFTRLLPLAAVGNLPGSLSPQVIASGLLDAGATPDVVIAQGNGLQVLLNPLGTGALVPAPLVTLANGDIPTSVAIADMNLDGINDLVFTAVRPLQNGPASVQVALGLGGGAYFLPFVTPLPDTFLAGLALGAIDAGASLDVFVGGNNAVYALLGTGAGTLAAAPTLTQAIPSLNTLQGASLATLDVDGDGQTDWLVPDDFGAIQVLRRTAPSTFVVQGPIVPNPTFAAVLSLDSSQDLTADGLNELVASDAIGNLVSVQVNTTPLQAWSTVLGTPFGGGPLTIGPLRFGSSPAIAYSGAPGIPVTLFVAPFPTGIPVNPFPFPCAIWLNIPLAQPALSGFTDGTGTFSVVIPPLPVIPVFAGVQFALQAVAANPGSANPIPFDFSNGVVTTFGF